MYFPLDIPIFFRVFKRDADRLFFVPNTKKMINFITGLLQTILFEIRRIYDRRIVELVVYHTIKVIAESRCKKFVSLALALELNQTIIHLKKIKIKKQFYYATNENSQTAKDDRYTHFLQDLSAGKSDWLDINNF